MRNAFNAQLDEMHRLLIHMGELCETVIDNTYQALMKEDRESAAEIIEKDGEIDQVERDIEGICLKLLLRQQPVASDLRRVSSALKMITDMERIGDQAADIAEIIKTGNLKAPAEALGMGKMAKATMKMVRDSIDSFVKDDLDLAKQVIDADDEVDGQFEQIRHMLADGLVNKSATQEQVLDLLMIAKYYERIGDHATNIAEWVEFSITGVHKDSAVIHES